MNWDDLTGAERAVTALVCEGLPNKEIARRLFVTPATVHWHLKNIFRKVGAANRTELAMKAAPDLAEHKSAVTTTHPFGGEEQSRPKRTDSPKEEDR